MDTDIYVNPKTYSRVGNPVPTSRIILNNNSNLKQKTVKTRLPPELRLLVTGPGN
jgi:hypothetical protein